MGHINQILSTNYREKTISVDYRTHATNHRQTCSHIGIKST